MHAATQEKPKTISEHSQKYIWGLMDYGKIPIWLK